VSTAAAAAVEFGVGYYFSNIRQVGVTPPIGVG
jgi:hypothetical protein